MKRVPTLLLFLGLPIAAAAQNPLFAVRDAGEGRSRTYDVQHYRIELSFDEEKKKVFGTTTITVVPFPDELTRLEFDAEDLDVTKVLFRGKSLKYEILPLKLAVPLDRPYSYRDTLAVAITYSCTPSRGLFFVHPDSAYPDKPHQIWTQGEDMDNHFWFPCYDFPNDMATSEMIVTVRDSYVALSNGQLVSVTGNRKQKTKTFHWKQDIPHVSYLIMLAAGDYTVLTDSAGKLPLEYWVYPNHVDDAKVCFEQTPNMIEWFNEKIGYPYPWAKYAQVLIRDFTVGGMENTSATSLADYATVYDARARVDESPTSLIAHELAHQWWGDVVTCKDWRHLWLNESFASYFDLLWHEAALGRDEFDFRIYEAQQSGINSDRTAGRKPIVSVGSYGANLYPRGASVLHILRFVLGDRLFWKAINHYITKYQHTVVETNDLKVAVEEATGQNLHWFFDQWVYKAGYPVFDLSWAWNDSAKSVLLSVKQTQKTDSLTGVFRTPVDIELTMPEGKSTHPVEIFSRDTTFMLRSPSKPTLVIFDKGNWLLKELRWNKPVAEWEYQAESATNPVDRLRAIQELSRREKSAAFIPLFSRIALHDRMWAVRREAIAAFDRIDSTSPEQKQQIAHVLIQATHDPRSAVRQAAVLQLRQHSGPEVVAAVRAALNDSSYHVVGNALRTLARVDSVNAVATIRQYLDMQSHRNTVEVAALGALSVVDTAAAFTEAFSRARYGKPFNVRATALAILGKYGRQRSDVRDLYVSILRERQTYVRSQAIRWLGDNADTTLVPTLLTIANDKKDAAAESAMRSVEKIRNREERREEREVKKAGQ
ncbi:MAG: M1 family aminopeptidase [Bacteroidota bacterium]